MDENNQTPQTTNVNINLNQPVLTADTKKINGILYFLMTWLFGFLGVHRFMRGQIGMGILYIFTFGILGIGLLVDFIMAIIYLFSMDKDGNIYFVNGKYSKVNN